MCKKKLRLLLLSIEILIVAALFTEQIAPNWLRQPSTGDIFALEVVAFLGFDIYGKIKDKI